MSLLRDTTILRKHVSYSGFLKPRWFHGTLIKSQGVYSSINNESVGREETTSSQSTTTTTTQSWGRSAKLTNEQLTSLANRDVTNHGNKEEVSVLQKEKKGRNPSFYKKMDFEELGQFIKDSATIVKAREKETTHGLNADFHGLSQFIEEAYSKKENEYYKYPDEYKIDMNSMITSYKANKSASLKSNVSPTFQSRVTIESLDPRLKARLYSECKSALTPTLEHIDNLASSQEVYNFYSKILQDVLDKLATIQKTPGLNSDFYLRSILHQNQRNQWSTLHDVLIEKIRQESANDPVKPLYNIITLPIITNHVFKLLGTKFFKGELLMTIFNMLKEDFHLHTLCCNQQAFNEVLKTCWIYYGNIDLFEFEKIFTEMTFLGYGGDYTTYNILKIVIEEYDALSNGKSVFNESGSKVLTKEDNKRMKFLEKEFQRLKINLENSFMRH